MKVQTLMSKDSLKYCTPDTKLHEAAVRMRQENCGALPVVDENKFVVGIVTDRDICMALSKNTTTPIQELPINDIMTRTVHTIKEMDDITLAYQGMRENKIQRLPVTDETGKLNGIISLDDLIIYTLENGGKLMGLFYEPGENLLKTLDAISNRHEAKVPA